jgi:hypothetical protein
MADDKRTARLMQVNTRLVFPAPQEWLDAQPKGKGGAKPLLTREQLWPLFDALEAELRRHPKFIGVSRAQKFIAVWLRERGFPVPGNRTLEKIVKLLKDKVFKNLPQE